MTPREVAIATMTLARDTHERTRLLASVRELAKFGIPVFVTDGGSGADFVDAMKALPNLNVCEPCGEGLWPQVARSLRAAHATGAKFVLYTEPDKHDFFRTTLERFIADASGDAASGVVLASRSQADFATFPAFQQYTESVINRCCAELIGQAADYSYGPFLLAARIVPHLDGLEHAIAWGWRLYAFGISHRLGLHVEHAAAGRPCPADQRDNEERVYRMLQLAQSLHGIVLATQANLGGDAL